MWWRKSKGMELLVLGAGRGGTSLLATLLDAHPQLEVHMEEFVPEFLVQPDPAKYPDAQSRLQAFVKACEQLASKSKLRFGNKITTEQLGFVDRFGKDTEASGQLNNILFQGRKILFITRDGRTCISSKMERTKADYPTALAYWKHSVSMLQDLKKASMNLHVLKFEDLLENPRKELKAVCDFLELSYSESMLSGTASDRILVDYRRKGLDSERARRVVHPEVREEDIREELESLGYL